MKSGILVIDFPLNKTIEMVHNKSRHAKHKGQKRLCFVIHQVLSFHKT